jgi:translation initiation factor IF-3
LSLPDRAACGPQPTHPGGSSIEREPRINEQIRVPEVRLIGEAGEQLGVKPLAEALRLARDLALDLVEVAPNAAPPVCRIMDYGKYKYQAAVKAKEARKRQSHIVIKEMKMRPKIDKHDYATKSRHVERFLREGSKVKATIMFRGREMAHAELGRRILDRLAVDMAEVAFVESAPNQDGRNMVMVLAPHRAIVEAARGDEGKPAEEMETIEAVDSEIVEVDVVEVSESGDVIEAIDEIEETEATS